jgi:hypothetical protein
MPRKLLLRRGIEVNNLKLRFVVTEHLKKPLANPPYQFFNQYRSIEIRVILLEEFTVEIEMTGTILSNHFIKVELWRGSRSSAEEIEKPKYVFVFHQEIGARASDIQFPGE